MKLTAVTSTGVSPLGVKAVKLGTKEKKGICRGLDVSADNTFGCHVSETGELHLHHNGRDVGLAWEGLPTDRPLWGIVISDGGWKVEANYVIPEGEAVLCDVVCGVMFVSLYICTC